MDRIKRLIAMEAVGHATTIGYTVFHILFHVQNKQSKGLTPKELAFIEARNERLKALLADYSKLRNKIHASL